MAVTATSVLGRRCFLVQASKGVLAFAVLGLAAACSSRDDETDVARGQGRAAPLPDWTGGESTSPMCRPTCSCAAARRRWWTAALGVVRTKSGRCSSRRHRVGSRAPHPDHPRSPRPPSRLDGGHHAGAGRGRLRWRGRDGQLPGWLWRQLRPVTDGEEIFGLHVIDTWPHPRPHRRLRYRLAGARRRRRSQQHHRRAERPDARSSPWICGQPKSQSANSPLWSPRSSSSAMVPPSSGTPPPSCDGWPGPNQLTASRKVLISTRSFAAVRKRTLMPLPARS